MRILAAQAASIHTQGMKYQSKVGERGQVVIPKPIRDNLRLDKNSAIEFELKGSTVTLRARPADSDMANFKLAIQKYAGSLRKSFLASGYKSVEEYIYDIRGREAFETPAACRAHRERSVDRQPALSLHHPRRRDQNKRHTVLRAPLMQCSARDHQDVPLAHQDRPASLRRGEATHQALSMPAVGSPPTSYSVEPSMICTTWSRSLVPLELRRALVDFRRHHDPHRNPFGLVTGCCRPAWPRRLHVGFQLRSFEVRERRSRSGNVSARRSTWAIAIKNS